MAKSTTAEAVISLRPGQSVRGCGGVVCARRTSWRMPSACAISTARRYRRHECRPACATRVWESDRGTASTARRRRARQTAIRHAQQQSMALEEIIGKGGRGPRREAAEIEGQNNEMLRCEMQRKEQSEATRPGANTTEGETYFPKPPGGSRHPDTDPRHPHQSHA